MDTSDFVIKEENYWKQYNKHKSLDDIERQQVFHKQELLYLNTMDEEKNELRCLQSKKEDKLTKSELLKTSETFLVELFNADSNLVESLIESIPLLSAVIPILDSDL